MIISIFFYFIFIYYEPEVLLLLSVSLLSDLIFSLVFYVLSNFLFCISYLYPKNNVLVFTEV